MTTLLVDTSGYVAFLRNNPQAVRAVQQAQEVLLPVIALGELLGGFAFGTRTTNNQQELSDFRISHRTRVVPITESTVQHYAQIYAHLRRTGRPIPTNDMWIAASALEHGARLLTGDGHFTNIPLLLLEYIQR